MSNIQSIMLHRYQHRWELILVTVVTVAVSGIVLVILARQGVLAANPWHYLGLAIAGWAGVAGMVLTIAEAMLEESTTSAHNRHEAELKMQRKQDRHHSRS